MYSDRFFRENDALKEFMTLCIECGMIPEISNNIRYNKILVLSGLGISVGVEISSDPVCIEIAFIKILSNHFYDMQHYYKVIKLVIGKLIDCSKRYNVTLGAWVSDDDICRYIDLGFRIIEKYDMFWVEYTPILS